MGSGLILILLFFCVTPTLLLCAKIADKTSWKVGSLFAFGLIVLPAALFAVGALYDSGIW